MSNNSLLDAAKKSTGIQDKITEDKIELAIAWAKGEVTFTQCHAALESKSAAGTYITLARSLKKYFQQQNK